MASKLLIKAAMNEAYWQAARAVCTNCANNEPAGKYYYGDGSYTWIHEVSGDECEANPIRDLIEKLNEVQE